MPKYEVDIPHQLAVDEAKQRIAGATEKLTRDYGASCTWQAENLLKVSRKGLDALVAVQPANVHVEMNLGFLLTPFAEKIKNGIAKQLSGILAAAPGN